MKPKTKREVRIYNDAYNNPSQYDIEKMKDGRLTEIVLQAITDRRKDEVDGNFKFKTN